MCEQSDIAESNRCGGIFCFRDEDCWSLRCDLFVCGYDKECREDITAETGRCDGLYCEEDSNCWNTNCVGNVCVSLPEVASSNLSSDSFSASSCSDSPFAVFDRCNGVTCTYDYECQSDYC